MKVLTALRVLETNVKLAVLAVLSGVETLTSLGNEAIVQQSEGAQVLGQNTGNSASIAARASIADASDLHTARWGLSGVGTGDARDVLRRGLGNGGGKGQGKGREKVSELHCNGRLE